MVVSKTSLLNDPTSGVPSIVSSRKVEDAADRVFKRSPTTSSSPFSLRTLILPDSDTAVTSSSMGVPSGRKKVLVFPITTSSTTVSGIT